MVTSGFRPAGMSRIVPHCLHVHLPRRFRIGSPLRCRRGLGYTETLRVTESSEQVTGPLAFKVPLVSHLAVSFGSTLATMLTPSPTALPDESLNLMCTV